MPGGFDQKIGSGLGDFVDLKDGDEMSFVLTGEPFVLRTHSLPDQKLQFGRSFPCGMDDKYACPICEDTTGTYDEETRKTKGNCYYPVFVHELTKKGEVTQRIGQHKTLRGGVSLHKALVEFYKAQKKFNVDVFNRPLYISRTGSGGQDTTFTTQVHPDPNIKIEPTGKPVDVEAQALNWIENSWKEFNYRPSGVHQPNGGLPPMNPPGNTATPDHDPFKELANA